MNYPAVYLSPVAFKQNRETNAVASRVDQLQATTALPVADKSQLPLVDFYLYWHDEKLTLRDQSQRAPVDICIDFCAGKNKHRLAFGGGYGQPVARALKIKPTSNLTVCDATGGLGADAFVFASLGCKVVIFERSKVIFALLQDAIARALTDNDICPIAQKMEALNLDSRHLAESWPYPVRPHAVYLDPMYPDTGKSAVTKKGMRTLQNLLPHENPLTTSENKDQQEHALLSAALSTASQRVVVKRPAKALPLAESTPVGCIKSPNTRYDVYKPYDV